MRRDQYAKRSIVSFFVVGAMGVLLLWIGPTADFEHKALTGLADAPTVAEPTAHPRFGGTGLGAADSSAPSVGSAQPTAPTQAASPFIEARQDSTVQLASPRLQDAAQVNPVRQTQPSTLETSAPSVSAAPSAPTASPTQTPARPTTQAPAPTQTPSAPAASTTPTAPASTPTKASTTCVANLQVLVLAVKVACP